MKSVKHLLFLASFLFLNFESITQCPPVILMTQEEVDNYLIDYPDCANGQANLKLTGNDITNLNGLDGIKKMAYLYLWDLPNVESLSGLDSLISLGVLELHLPNLNNIEALKNLDTLGKLDISFTNQINDLSVFEDLKALNILWTSGNGSLDGLSSPLTHMDLKFTENPSVQLYIVNNSIPNSLENIFDPSMDYIKSVTINACSNISFNGLSQIDSIGSFFIWYSEELSLNGLEYLQNINRLSFNDFTDIDLDHKFDNLNKIGSLEILNNAGLSSLKKYFPSLDSISRSIELIGNPDLIDLAPLELSQPPQNTPAYFDTRFRIQIEDNPLLESCDSYLICRAKEIYPDSLFVENNGENCSQEWLEDLDCSTILSQEEIQLSHINIYPNPTTDIIYIESENRNILEIEIYDVSSQLIFKKSNISSINLEALQNGIYTFLIKTEKKNYRKRVIKI